MAATKFFTAAVAAVLAAIAVAQQTLYGQCGGIGWTGATTCVTGACCIYSNEYYSQCISGDCATTAGTTMTTTTAGATTLTTTTKTSTTTTTAAAAVASATGSYTNPVMYEDLADLDVFRVDDTFYYSASTMHYSPGAPILRSYDLVNWEYIGHSVPSLSWSSKYNLTGTSRAYVEGIWASSMRYRPSNGMWYWIGCIEFATTYVYTATEVTGPWTLTTTLDTCFYDCGLFFDDDDTPYVAYGNTELYVAQLSGSTLSTIVKTELVYTAPSSVGALEGSRMYKRNSIYYICTDHPASQEWVLQAPSPFGTYTAQLLADGLTTPISGGGYSHQGGLVQTQNDEWYYMAFQDAYPGGRIPVLAPVTWGSDGFPTLTLVDGTWGTTYQMPLASQAVTSSIGTDSFSGTSLGPAWEWNHNPDTTKFTVNNGLTLSTATVTYDIYQARNTLTHRIHGPYSTATILLDSANMAAGDRAGLVLLRDVSAWIGIKNDGGSLTVGITNDITMNADWSTASTGATVASENISKGTIYLRGTANITPGDGRTATFSYSTDGTTYTTLGPTFTLNSTWEFFMGYRWGIFNYATSALGGSVKVTSFTQTVSSS